MSSQTLPFLGPNSCLCPVSLTPVADTRRRLLVVEGPFGLRLDVSFGSRTATIVQQIAQLKTDGIGLCAHKVGAVALVRPLPKNASAADALALLQDSLAEGLTNVDALLDAVQRTLKALARRSAWIGQCHRTIHLYMSIRKTVIMNLGGAYIQEAPRLPTFALDQIFAGKIAIVHGQIRPVRGVSVNVMPESIATSYHERLPLMADAILAWRALGYDAADWLSKANEVAEASRC